MPGKVTNKFWGVTYIIVSLAGWACFFWLMSSPSETANAILLGFSLQRILLAIVLIVPSGVFTYFAIDNWRLFKTDRITLCLEEVISKSPRFWNAFGLGVFVLGIAWLLFFLPERRAIQWFGPLSLYIQIIKPLLLYAFIFSLLFLTNLLIAKFGIDIHALNKEKGVVRMSLALFSGLLILVFLISTSGIGLGFDASIWNAPGTPVLITQTFVALLFGLLLVMIILRIQKNALRNFADKKNLEVYIDLGVAILIWFFTAAFWIAQPAPSTYYDTPPLPPNFQSYPLSDAFNHDVIANNVLIGEGFRFGGQVAIRRPVYVLFLAGFEALLGANYDAVLTAQILVLALFPALLYLLGAKLHSRVAGIFLAGIVVFREANSIVIGDVINTSHAKLLMADLPTALMIAGLTLGVVAWLRRGPRNLLASLLVGGLLGWAILLRSQSLTLLPFLVLLPLLIWGWRSAWRPIAALILGVSLVAGPWIMRNRVLMGQWAIEDAVVSGFLANRYSFTPGTFGLPFLSGETEGEYYARQMAHVREFAFQNPAYVAGFVADNFVRNQLLNFLATPLSLELRDLESHVRELPYWPGWQGNVPPESYLPIVFNLAMISLGVVVAWQRFGWIGIVPLFINVGFTMNLALARVSGWRYNLPIDWTMLLYYAIGTAQIIFWKLLAMKSTSARYFVTNEPNRYPRNTSKQSARNFHFRPLFVAIVGLGLLGSIFLIIEGLNSRRYVRLNQQEASSLVRQTKLPGTVTEIRRDQLLELIDADKVSAVNGRALHPRYYRAGDGEPGREFLLVDPMDFDRITFYLIGPDPASVILRVESPDILLPASSDVVVFRCDNSMEAIALIVNQEIYDPMLYVSADPAQSCPALAN